MYNHKPESTRCTALTNRGKFCDYESLPDAPFPICVKHAAMLLRFLNGVMPTSIEDRVILAARDFEYHPMQQRRSATAGVGVVYYLRVGANIKVGFTTDLRQRLNSYPPDSLLLACEPGDYSLEQQRHREFRDLLRAGKEWFEPGPKLMAHIVEMRKQHKVSDYMPAKRSPLRSA